MIAIAGLSFEFIMPLDNVIQDMMAGWHSLWLDTFFVLITRLGNPMAFYILAPLVAVILLWQKKRLDALFITFCLLTSWGVMNGLKLIFSRPRPPEPALVTASGYSFPSGHAVISLAFYGFIAFLILKSWNNTLGRCAVLVISVIILLIGVSRVYLNVHYASDVIAGYLIGAIILRVFIWGLEKMDGKATLAGG